MKRANSFGSSIIIVLAAALAAEAATAPKIEFAAYAKFGVGTKYDLLAAGDFNNDQKADLAAIGLEGQKMSVFLNNGTGNLVLFTNYTVSGWGQSITTGDFNRDGKLDVVTTYQQSGTALLIWLGSGDGRFSSRMTSGMGDIKGMATGDFNHDGKLDLATASMGVRVLLGRGDGFVDIGTTYGSETTYDVAAAYLNGDTNLDLVTGNYSSSSMTVRFGNGDGTFSGATNYSGDFSEYHNTVVATDLNNDGAVDLATINQYNSSVSVRLNNGDGTFGTEARFKVRGWPAALQVGDLNGDGNKDLVATSGDSSLPMSILPGLGNGVFGTALTNYPGMGYSVGNRSCVLADWNGDGRLDIATTRLDTNAVTVLFNQTVPALAVEREEEQLRITWPNWTGYVLQTSTNLKPSEWIAATNALIGSGDRQCVTNAVTEARQFYRLKKQ